MCLITVVSILVPVPTEDQTSFVFNGVCPVLQRMSQYVTVITAREVYRYKMACHGDKFLHIGAVTFVNNRDHTLHYAIEEEIQS